MLDPERVFSRFDILDRPALIVAISGGSDSTALLLLLHDFLSRHGHADRLHAVTVDHALRPESADEARRVAAFCAEREIRHRTLTWRAAKPATGIAAAARTARYQLLTEAADAIGTDLIFTGHTADDQAETLAMRGARGAGIGLSGMSPDTLLDGHVWLLRPLLDISREALRDDLRARGIGWIDDPSNESSRSERVRVRRALDGGQRGALLDHSRQAATARADLAIRSAGLIADAMSIEGDRIRLAASLFDCRGRDAAIHALRLLLATLGAGDHLPDLARSVVLFEGLAALGHSSSLSGCVANHRRAGITVRPEARRGGGEKALPVTTLFAGKPMRPIIPGFDLPAYRALAKLLSAREIPASPLSRHNGSFP